jgi:hypothetical protein
LEALLLLHSKFSDCMILSWNVLQFAETLNLDFGLWLAKEPEVLSTTTWGKKKQLLVLSGGVELSSSCSPRKNGNGIWCRNIQVSYLHVCHHQYFFLQYRLQRGKKKKSEIPFLPSSHVWRFAWVATTLRAEVQLPCTKPVVILL